MTEFKCNKCHGTSFSVLANQGEMICRGCGKHFDIFVTQLKMPAVTKKEIRERLAALEHEQWIHWTKYMIENLTTENILLWRKEIEAVYEELSEKQKDSDREWADKVLSIIAQYVIEPGGAECHLPKRKSESKSRFKRRR